MLRNNCGRLVFWVNFSIGLRRHQQLSMPCDTDILPLFNRGDIVKSFARGIPQETHDHIYDPWDHCTTDIAQETFHMKATALPRQAHPVTLWSP